MMYIYCRFQLNYFNMLDLLANLPTRLVARAWLSVYCDCVSLIGFLATRTNISSWEGVTDVLLLGYTHEHIMAKRIYRLKNV